MAARKRWHDIFQVLGEGVWDGGASAGGGGEEGKKKRTINPKFHLAKLSNKTFPKENQWKFSSAKRPFQNG